MTFEPRLRCDGCGATGQASPVRHIQTAAHLRSYLVTWHYDRETGRDLCPDCRPDGPAYPLSWSTSRGREVASQEPHKLQTQVRVLAALPLVFLLRLPVFCLAGQRSRVKRSRVTPQAGQQWGVAR